MINKNELTIERWGGEWWQFYALIWGWPLIAWRKTARRPCAHLGKGCPKQTKHCVQHRETRTWLVISGNCKEITAEKAKARADGGAAVHVLGGSAFFSKAAGKPSENFSRRVTSSDSKAKASLRPYRLYLMFCISYLPNLINVAFSPGHEI